MLLEKLLDRVKKLDARYVFHYGVAIEQHSPGSRGGSIRILFDSDSAKDAEHKIDILERTLGGIVSCAVVRTLNGVRYVVARLYYTYNPRTDSLEPVQPGPDEQIYRGYLADWLDELAP